MVKMEWNEIDHFYMYFFFSDSENAILIRISLKAAMGVNAVSIKSSLSFVTVTLTH